MSGLYSRRKGAKAERDTVNYLKSVGFPYMDRNKIGSPVGDLLGTPGLVWEVKDQKTLCLPAWIRQLEDEIDNSGYDTGVLVVKQTGKANPADWYAIQPLWRWVRLAHEAGW